APVGAGGVPGVPLAGYQRAERILASTAPGCRLRWPLLAALGRAESGHANGGRVDAAGRTLERIVGPRLDGSYGRPRVPDTDGGALDGDRIWDRAVGPMQLLPSVWRRYATAADARTAPDPDNVFDAALTAGRFLCAGGADLDVPDRQAEAIRRYRDSPSYLAAVRAWATGYAEGAPSVPLLTPAPKPSSSPRPPSALPKSPPSTRPPAAVPRPPLSSVPKPLPSTRPPAALPESSSSQQPTPSRDSSGSRESRSEVPPPSARPTPSSSPSSRTRTPTGSATPSTSRADTVGPIIVVEPTIAPAVPSTLPRSTEAPGPTGLAGPPSGGSRAPASDPSGSITPTQSTVPSG
ncbi:MAG: lytic transglycosylase, partial [Pseudonocardia sp.]|nr:lytic transglycosylase [Pseudonocardia sp.]